MLRFRRVYAVPSHTAAAAAAALSPLWSAPKVRRPHCLCRNYRLPSMVMAPISPVAAALERPQRRGPSFLPHRRVTAVQTKSSKSNVHTAARS